MKKIFKAICLTLTIVLSTASVSTANSEHSSEYKERYEYLRNEELKEIRKSLKQIELLSKRSVLVTCREPQEYGCKSTFLFKPWDEYIKSKTGFDKYQVLRKRKLGKSLFMTIVEL